MPWLAGFFLVQGLCVLLSPRPFFVLDSVSVSRLLLFIADCNFSLKIDYHIIFPLSAVD